MDPAQAYISDLLKCQLQYTICIYKTLLLPPGGSLKSPY